MRANKRAGKNACLLRGLAGRPGGKHVVCRNPCLPLVDQVFWRNKMTLSGGEKRTKGDSKDVPRAETPPPECGKSEFTRTEPEFRLYAGSRIKAVRTKSSLLIW